MAVLEGLNVDLAVGVPLEEKNSAVAIEPVGREAPEEPGDGRFVPRAVAACGHDLDPKHVFITCPETEGILKEPCPVTTGLLIPDQPTATEHDTQRCSYRGGQRRLYL